MMKEFDFAPFAYFAIFAILRFWIAKDAMNRKERKESIKILKTHFFNSAFKIPCPSGLAPLKLREGAVRRACSLDRYSIGL